MVIDVYAYTGAKLASGHISFDEVGPTSYLWTEFGSGFETPSCKFGFVKIFIIIFGRTQSSLDLYHT